LGSVSFASSAPLQDFGPFILGNHALDLKQELIFRCLAYLSVEEDHLNSIPEKLFEQEDLVSIVACQPIRTMHVELINAPSRSHIAQAFQGRANESGPTVAVVDKLEFRRENHSLLSKMRA
jgi:hypothetical protein